MYRGNGWTLTTDKFIRFKGFDARVGYRRWPHEYIWIAYMQHALMPRFVVEFAIKYTSASYNFLRLYVCVCVCDSDVN